MDFSLKYAYPTPPVPPAPPRHYLRASELQRSLLLEVLPEGKGQAVIVVGVLEGSQADQVSGGRVSGGQSGRPGEWRAGGWRAARQTR